jgi:hypothetical protein
VQKRAFCLFNLCLYLLAFSALTTRATASSSEKKELRVRVHFLATSTSVRGSWFQSQDVFLVGMLRSDTDTPSLARLIDQYPAYRRPLSTNILSGDGSVFLHLRRDPACDIAFAAMPLRAAAGDPMAILPERLDFNPKLPRSINAAEILPCYRILKRE